MKKVPPLLAISDRRSLSAGESLETWFQALAADGVPMVQLREKDLDDRALYELALEARKRLPATVVLINERMDIALAAGCDGVHLPTDGPPTTALRRRFGEEVWIGVSTHHPEEVARAAEDGADYATFGPIYPTPSKAAYGAPSGIEGLARAKASAPTLPILALGGIFSEHLPALAAAGAHGAAGIRTFQDARQRAALLAGAAVFPAERDS